MLRRTCVLAFTCLASAAGAQRPVDSAAAAAIKAHYRKLEVRIPMRDGVQLFTSIYVPRDTSASVPIHHGSHAVRRRALRRRTHIAPSLGPSGNPNSPRRDSSSSIQDARGRYYSEGDVHRDDAAQGAQRTPRTSTSPPTRTTRSTGWSRTFRTTTAASRIYGTSYPGFYTTASCIDPHPALKACEPGAPMTDLWMGDDLFHNGAFMLGANFAFYQGFGRTPRAPDLGPDPRYPRPRQCMTTPTSSSSGWVPVGPGSRKSLPPETAPLWDIVMHHPAYDDVLAGARHQPAREARAGDARGGRLLRRRGSRRSVADVPRHREARAGLRQSHRDRTVVARRLGARRRQRARHAALDTDRPVRGSATRSSSRSSCTI